MTSRSDQHLLDTAREMADGNRLKACVRCGHAFRAGEQAHHRVYELPHATVAHAAFCDPCNTAFLLGSAAEAKFKRELSVTALLHRPGAGNA